MQTKKFNRPQTAISNINNIIGVQAGELGDGSKSF